MLGRMCAGFGMVGLAGLLGPRALAGSGSSGAMAGPHFAPRARRVIFLFLNGGPSHVDTFDPKPALKKYAGEKPEGDLYRKNKVGGFMPSPFEFTRCGQSGIEVCDTLPNLGRIIDDCCVIRSMKTDTPNHEPALLQMHTGNIQPIRPSMGSWLLYGLGTENHNLPGYVVLRPTPKIVVGPALWSNSFLPAEYQAASVITADMRVDKLVANIRNPNLTAAQQREQLDLLDRLNGLHLRKRGGDTELEGQIKAMETAFHMQSRAMRTFDISREPESVRRGYGETPFGRSCLLARRLVEDGVRCVTVYYVADDNQPWDTHTNHNDRHRKLCADGDVAAAALISDLKARGLLDETLVIFGGEFGRTPYAEIRDKEKDSDKVGRDHHHTGFSMLLAVLASCHVWLSAVQGPTDTLRIYAVGDINLGRNLGRTVLARGDTLYPFRALADTLHVHDLHATILHLLGLDHEKLTYRYSGRDFRLTDVHGRVLREIQA